MLCSSIFLLIQILLYNSLFHEYFSSPPNSFKSNFSSYLLGFILKMVTALYVKAREFQFMTHLSRKSHDYALSGNIFFSRFVNVLGRETIHTLEFLTSKITSIFCHPTMVDRIAAMLNYFLSHLVGPKKKHLKVHV